MTRGMVFLPARFIAYLPAPIGPSRLSGSVGHAVMNVLVSPDGRRTPTRFPRRAAHGRIQRDMRSLQSDAAAAVSEVHYHETPFRGVCWICPYLAKLDARIKGIDCQDSFQALIREMLPCDFGLD